MFQLYRYRGGVRAQNSFGRKPRDFDADDEAVGSMLATLAAVALIEANKERQFESALAGRDLIGQAKGIVMERFDVDAQRAFELLRKLSQDSTRRCGRSLHEWWSQAATRRIAMFQRSPIRHWMDKRLCGFLPFGTGFPAGSGCLT